MDGPRVIPAQRDGMTEPGPAVSRTWRVVEGQESPSATTSKRSGGPNGRF